MSKERSVQQREEELAAKIHSEWILRGGYFDLRADTIEAAGKKPQTWHIAVRPDAVVILPVTEEGNILFVKQWRRAIDKIILELPAGAVDEGEEPLIAAQRELQEETGYKAHRLTPLGGFFSTPGFCTEYLHFFIAEELEVSPLPHDENEAIDVASFSLEEALALIDKCAFCDVKTIAGLLLYDRWRKK
jgi:ADP-ribose pyrophosphatase